MASEKKLKILVIAPNPEDGTSFYRGWGPLLSLSKQYPWIQLLRSNQSPSWCDFKSADVVFFQRPDVPMFLKPLKEALQLGKPVWVDYDDLLTDIPFSNPVHVHYWQENVQDVIKTFLRCSTAITLSTQSLGTFMCPERKDAVIILNAWDNDFYPKFNNPKNRQNISVAWRGSNTHDEDLLSIVNDLPTLTNVEWNFFGNPSWQFTNAIPENSTVNISPWSSLLDFNQIFFEASPAIVIVPLAEHKFNYSKSNCAWIEATRAGAVVLAPNFSEWRKPGITNYSPGEFGSKLTWLTNMPLSERKNLWNQSWAHINQNLALSKINKLRLNLLNKLVNP